MEKPIGKVLSIEKISDIRLRISLAKEFVSTDESQDGLYRMVKTVLEGVASLMSMILMCFTCLSNFAEAFAGKSKESEEKRETQKAMSQKELDELDELIANLESRDKTIYPDSPSEEHVNLSIEMMEELEVSKRKFDFGVRSEVKEKESSKMDFNISIEETDVKIFVERDLIPVLVHILDKLWEYRFEVNPLSVCIIEIMYEWVVREANNNEPPKIKRELGDKLLSDFKSLWTIIRTKYNQKLPNFGDDMESNRDSFLIHINQIFEISQGLSDTKYEETLALHLSHTPVFHLKDVLIFQEKKRQYQGDLRNLVKTIMVEYQSLYAENQIREITEWLDNTIQNTPSNIISITKVQDNCLFRVNSVYHLQIANAFAKYFDEIDMNIFIRLLEGEKSNYKVKFKGSSSQLVFAFRILAESEKNIITNQKKEVESWLINHFQFLSKNSKLYEDLKSDSVRTAMSRGIKGFQEPKNAVYFDFL